jgi:hypothetical protein
VFRGKQLCAACHTLKLKSVRLWSTTLVAAVGTLMPPVGWILAGVDWWRLGLRSRVLLPIAAFAARVGVLFTILGAPLFGGPPALYGAGLNLASMLLATMGLPRHVRAHRAAGGESASWIVAVGLALLPLFCFGGLYYFFSNPPGQE